MGDTVSQGACRKCLSAEERRRYKDDVNFREMRKARRDMRRRNMVRVPVYLKEDLVEQFDGECAYCNRPATTMDHFHPISKGGKTTVGNILPCCSTCNSSKGKSDPERWLQRAPLLKVYTIEYLVTMGEL